LEQRYSKWDQLEVTDSLDDEEAERRNYDPEFAKQFTQDGGDPPTEEAQGSGNMYPPNRRFAFDPLMRQRDIKRRDPNSNPYKDIKRDPYNDGWVPMQPPILPDKPDEHVNHMKFTDMNKNLGWMDKLEDWLKYREQKGYNFKDEFKLATRRLKKKREWEKNIEHLDRVLKSEERNNVNENFMVIMSKLAHLMLRGAWRAALDLRDVYERKVSTFRQRDECDSDFIVGIINTCHSALPEAWHKALELREEMDDRFLSPTSMVYHAEIDSNYHIRKWERALDVLEQMMRATLNTDYQQYPMFTTGLQICSEQRKPYKAIHIMNWMDRMSVVVQSQAHALAERRCHDIIEEEGIEYHRPIIYQVYFNSSCKLLPNGKPKPLLALDRDSKAWVFFQVPPRFREEVTPEEMPESLERQALARHVRAQAWKAKVHEDARRRRKEEEEKEKMRMESKDEPTTEIDPKKVAMVDITFAMS